jgi:hypothetical protein
MKRLIPPSLTLVALLAAGAAHATSIGAGAFGGVSIPIANDLATQGTQFGARVPVGVLPFLTLEPYFASSGLGDVEEDFGTGTSYTRDGGDITAFGVNARLFGASAGMVRFYPYVGLGSHTLAREGSDDVTEIGYQGGIGVGVSPMPKFWIDLRGEFNAIVTGDTSQKFGNVTLGVTYDLISLP